MLSHCRLRLGTRRSRLALWQAEFVAEALRNRGVGVALVEISTQGDLNTLAPIDSFGEIGVFTNAIQTALLDQRIDLAVHSLKDLPIRPVPGLTTAAVPTRADPADALVLPNAQRTESMPDKDSDRDESVNAALGALRTGAIVGTSSARRAAQVRRARPDLETAPVRGNVESRVQQLDNGQFDALILAVCGLERLGLADRIACRLPFDPFLPAPGQGALAIECRSDDDRVCKIAAKIESAESHLATMAERTVLADLGAGCSTPVGALCLVDNRRLHLTAAVFSTDGAVCLREEASGDFANPVALGGRVAARLLSAGAGRLLAAAQK